MDDGWKEEGRKKEMSDDRGAPGGAEVKSGVGWYQLSCTEYEYDKANLMLYHGIILDLPASSTKKCTE